MVCTCRSLVDNHEVLRAYQLREYHIQNLGVELRENHLHHIILGLRLHIGIIVEEIVDERVDQLGICAGAGLVGLGLILGKNLGLRSLHFSVIETEPAGLLDLEQERLGGRKGFSVLELGDAHHDFESLTKVADVESSGEERCVRLGAEVVEALGEDL